MEYLLAGLLVFSCVLIIVSFLLKDPYKELKAELDEFSMQQLQEIYLIKKKVKILEEELLIDDKDLSIGVPVQAPRKEIHAIIKNQVWSLSQQGLSIEQIAKQSSLSTEDVIHIIEEFSLQGDRYE